MRNTKDTDIKALQKKIDDYFLMCDNTPVTNKRPYTMYGLMEVAGYETTDGYADACKSKTNGEVAGVLKRAKRKLIMKVEESLLSGNKAAAGAIFWLTNVAKECFKHTQQIDTNTVNVKEQFERLVKEGKKRAEEMKKKMLEKEKGEKVVDIKARIEYNNETSE